MLPVTFCRKSSIENLSYCEHQWYLTYILGYKTNPNPKSEWGTVTHKVLELLALCKLALQQKKNSIVDKEIGLEFSFTEDDLYKPTTLSPLRIDEINSSRINKDVYKTNCQLKYGHTRYGSELVEYLIPKVYEYYKKHSPNKWPPISAKHVNNWVWMTLDYMNGLYDPRKHNIVAPEQFFEIEIKEPWAQYSYNYKGKKLDGYLKLKGTIDLTIDHGDNLYEIIDWKGLPVHTKIPTPNGWTTMGEINVGDKLFDQNGKQCRVLGKSKIKNKECYTITFDDTSTVTCDNEHLWKLSNNDTKCILDLKIGDKINVAKPLDCDYIDLPMDPYLLGVWLGDGRNRSCEITGADLEIFEEIERRGYKLGPNQEKRRNKAVSRTVYNVTHILRQLNLLHNKHIPDIYLRASYQQRLDLLRGLMDTDGNVNPTRKQCVFTNCNLKLSQDVKQLLLSLGQRPLLSYVTSDTHFNSRDHIQEKFYKNVKVYPVSFRPININPHLLPRKHNIVNPEWGPGKSNIRTIVKIEKSIIQQTQCLSVDSVDNTYLCTENMIPTHNTGSRKCWTTGEVKTYKKLQTEPQLLLYFYVAQQIYKVDTIVSIFYIRDGGPYTLCYTKEKIEEALDLFKRSFDRMRNMTLPKLLDPTHKDFRCKLLCDYKKNTIGGQTVCHFIHDQIVQLGIDKVTEIHSQDDHHVDKYQAPGSVC